MKKKNKRLLIIGLIIFFGLIIWLLPPFIYNELEGKFRTHGYMATVYFNLVEDGIYERQQGGASSYYDTLFEIGDNIESQLQEGLDNLQIAQKYNDQQRFYLLFLN